MLTVDFFAADTHFRDATSTPYAMQRPLLYALLVSSWRQICWLLLSTHAL